MDIQGYFRCVLFFIILFIFGFSIYKNRTYDPLQKAREVIASFKDENNIITTPNYDKKYDGRMINSIPTPKYDKIYHSRAINNITTPIYNKNIKRPTFNIITTPKYDKNDKSRTTNVRTQPPPTECKCLKKMNHANTLTIENLDLPVPWLNYTTKEDLEKHHPNFPAEFLFNASKFRSCNLIPTIFSIEWRNRNWQELIYEDNEKFLMYSAFYDPNPGGEHCLRILGVSREPNPSLPYCHIWYSTQQPPKVSKVIEAAYIDYQAKTNRRQMVYILKCPLPTDDKRVPSAVSLVPKPCTPAFNLLKVIGSRERKPSAYKDGKVPSNLNSKDVRWNAAVCGPGLYYFHRDFSHRLVEWIEIHRAVGFDRVFVHNLGVHPNMEKVLQYYEKEGFVGVTHFSFPPPYTDEPSLHRLWTSAERTKLFALENVFYSDCPLRHMHQYRYLAHNDADELTILKQDNSYSDFLHRLRQGSPNALPGYKLQYNYYYDDLEPKGKAKTLPEYLWVLRHTRRLVEDIKHPSPGQFKTIYDMDKARGMFAHGTLWCTTGWCGKESMDIIPPDVAYIGHFTEICGAKCLKENYTKEDLILHKHFGQVSVAVEKTLRDLQLI